MKTFSLDVTAHLQEVLLALYMPKPEGFRRMFGYRPVRKPKMPMSAPIMQPALVTVPLHEESNESDSFFFGLELDDYD